MSRWDNVKGLKQTATDRLQNAPLSEMVADAVVAAADVIDGAEAVAQRSGLTKRDGSVSKLKVARAALTPAATGRKLLGAAADEVQHRRQSSGSEQPHTEGRS